MSFGSDAIVAQLKEDGGPITRERYILFRYLGTPPEELSAEEEAEIPDYPWDDEETDDGSSRTSEHDEVAAASGGHDQHRRWPHGGG